MQVNRIDHFNIRTPLLEETLSFYEKLLQLRRGRASGMDQARNAWLYDAADAPIIHVNMTDPGENLGSSEGAISASDTGRLHHVALDCRGFDEVLARIGDMGVTYRETYIEEIDLRQLFVIDPNGIRIEMNFRGGV